MSILQNLTEGVVNRDLSKEGEAILNKWEKTGLLEGLEGDFHRNQMAVLLENQAKELLRESNTMAGGDVEGFAAVAFPIVRRVFGGLLAQKLVSVQPMSLPSGLVFFMDFVKQVDAGRGRDDGQTDGNPSVYGGQVVGSELLNGVELNPDKASGHTPQLQDLVHGMSIARGLITAGEEVGDPAADVISAAASDNFQVTGIGDTDAGKIDFDADLLSGEGGDEITIRTLTILAGSDFDRVVLPEARHIVAKVVTANTKQVRRLSECKKNADGTFTLKLVFVGSAVEATPAANMSLEFGMSDNLVAGKGLGAVVGSPAWELEALGASNGAAHLPEIAIKVDSTAITAVTRKLKASWTPELAQDLNAYHNLDAEVELTGILSEQIALEIDQEILSDLIAGASASKLYWSRRPGLFVNRLTGEDATSLASPPDFTGSVSEWYETLVETINDVSADIHRKTLRGGANFLVCGPEVANILEFTTGFRASVTHDDATGSVGAVQIGSINKKWDLHVDPYFPRNVILVGRKGGSFLESGFVYAPYVPLQVTPTIFDADDFTPRKAVMTRYGKKMVRPDMYGLVVVRDLEG